MADDSGHDLVHAFVRPFFLAVFGECQLVAKNLHAAEMDFERHDQSRAIDLGEQDVLNVSKRIKCTRCLALKVAARAEAPGP
jgi:hypothetical protein